MSTSDIIQKNIAFQSDILKYNHCIAGKTEEELPNIRWGPFTKYADTYPLIWKQFIDNGYVTLYGEDYPLIETFQMRMNGFDKAPVDHYMRPFWQAAYDVDPNLRQRGTHPCLNGQPRHRYMLNYLKEFFRKYPKVPKFALEHLTGLSADDPNMVQHAGKCLCGSIKCDYLLTNKFVIMYYKW